MKYLYLAITELVFIVNSGAKDQPFFPNLPTGEYRVFFKAIMSCATYPNPDLQFNWKLSKISRNITELRGNVTTNIPVDDSLTILLNLAVKDSIGGWKDNALNYKSLKGCSTIKHFLGPTTWAMLLVSHGMNNTNCPVGKGTYVLTKSFDLTSAMLKSNFPKVFFYGTYKARLSFNDKFDNQRGCIVFVIELKRPWETI